MEKNISSTERNQTGEVKWIDEKYISYLYVLIGILLLATVPYAMTIKAGIFNDDVLILNTVFSIFIIVMGILEFLNLRGKLNILASYFPIIMIIVGVATTFLYSHFYDTSWDKTLHLYIINITDSGTFHIAYYKARDLISEMSSVGGIVIILGGIYQILYRRVGKNSH